MSKTKEKKEVTAEEPKPKTFKKLLDLYPGLSIWLVDISLVREQDKNARVMDKVTFDRLKKNLEADKRLESLPLGYVRTNGAGNQEFNIISGHHRTRAALMAGITELYVIVIEEELTEDQIKSKQLAHNAIAGIDDAQVLKELYNSIQDVEEKIKSGITEMALTPEKFKPVSVDSIDLEFDYKCVKIMFLASQATKFEEMVKEIGQDETVLIADHAQFDDFAKTLRELSGNENIRNVASIMGRMCEIVCEYIKDNPKEPAGKRTKSIADDIEGME